MSPEEMAKMREIYQRQQEGYRLMELERRQKIKNTVTKEELRHYAGLENMIRKRPKRTTSGLTEMYALLSKLRG